MAVRADVLWSLPASLLSDSLLTDTDFHSEAELTSHQDSRMHANRLQPGRCLLDHNEAPRTSCEQQATRRKATCRTASWSSRRPGGLTPFSRKGRPSLTDVQ